jgi:hypothetical protein
MKIYKLVPTGRGSGDWARSTYRGEVIIRAENDRDARAIAAFSFGIAKTVTPGEKVTVGPWDDRESVSCAETNGQGYEVKGLRGVIEPADWLEVVPFDPPA